MKIVKSILMLVADVFFIIIIMFCVDNIWDTYNGREVLEFEFIATMEFDGNRTEVLEGEAPPAIHGYIPMKNKNTPDVWFYEVRNQKEWDYYCSLIGIDDKDYVIDFSEHYYVFSISRPIIKIYLETDVWWDTREYGNLVRVDFDLNKYKSNTIYLYCLCENIDFYYNDRDYQLKKHNMTIGEQNGLIDEPYEPYLEEVYPKIIEY